MKNPKPVIGIDIDDVLIDFNDAVLKFHNQNYGTHFKVKDIVEFAFEKLWNCTTEEVNARVTAFYNSPLHIQIKPVAGAVKAVEKLAKKYDLVAVSARPSNVLVLTQKLLDLYFKGNLKKVILTNAFSLTGHKKTKAEVCQEINATVLIDDSLANALECSKQKISVILLRRLWNQEMTDEDLLKNNIYPAKNWPEILKVVMQLEKTTL